MCSWVPANGLLSLEECVICADNSVGPQDGGCSWPTGMRAWEGEQAVGCAARSSRGRRHTDQHRRKELAALSLRPGELCEWI